MLPSAISHSANLSDLKLPVAIIAGASDRVIDTVEQSARLHRDVSKSEFSCLAGEGHMIQQTATSSVMAAIESVAAQANDVRNAAVCSASN
jgi:pimeloyl-ACP methyl ester carboxylesterase